ncbi:hypothetical protein [Streptomyces sp. NPDC048565]|uniref:hypothetical protein n=1 Tax=Streptomyces sp. NPDC048565 TaxID=3155266 RepID=UPI00342AA395
MHVAPQARTLRPAVPPALEKPLLAYVNERLELADHRRGPELARMAWTAALGTLRPATDAGMDGDIPIWLAQAARQVIREQTSPVFHARLLTVVNRPVDQAPTRERLAA